MGELDHIKLLEALDYDPLTGIFTWRDDRPLSHFKNMHAKKVYLSKFAGKQAGHKYRVPKADMTYMQIRLFYKTIFRAQIGGILRNRKVALWRD